MALQSKALADLSSEQTSAADTDLQFIESAGTPAKITVGNMRASLLSSAPGTDLEINVASGQALRVFGYNGTDELVRVFDEGGVLLNYQGDTRLQTTTAGVTVFGPLIATRETYTVFHEETSGTSGGTITQNTWNLRTLNSEGENNITGASLSANQVTLPAGTYEAEIVSSGYRCGNFITRLYDDTAGAAVAGVKGMTSKADTDGGSTDAKSIMSGTFTLGVESALQVEQNCTDTHASAGMGVSSGFAAEIHCIAKFTRIA